jgi:tripartite-type tricarboxylate transporter receptor subunit TctC
MRTITRRTLLITAGLAPAVAPSLAAAQALSAPAWPTRPVTLIIPFPAGGAMDLLGRGVAEELTDKLGQPFVVDNRAGAAGNIGAMAAAKAPPDGYTVLMAGAGSLAFNAFMFPNMPYDPEPPRPIRASSMPGFRASARPRTSPWRRSCGRPGPG